MAGIETFITFIIYLVFLMGIGIYFYTKTNTHEDYVLGGRGVGYWVTAMSAQASDMSGWLLMGLPGAVFLNGLTEIWVIVGLALGTYANWKWVAPKLRVQTEETDTMTLPTFLTKKFKDPTNLIRTVSAIAILFFFTIYSSSGLVASGKLFETILGINYTWGVVIGGGTIIVYIFLGGYLACCWTDFFQGVLMFFAITIVPIVAYFYGGQVDGIQMAMKAREVSLNIFSKKESIDIFVILSGLAWGLGYFGQPHILVRFMSIDKVEELWKSRLIAMVWVVISLVGAIAVGITGIAVFSNVIEIGGDAEKIFIYMIAKLFNPWIGGVLFAAILSAIMSTISSQLLVSSNTLTEDFYKFFKRKASNKELIWVGRVSILIIFFVAGLLSLNPNSMVLSLVAYAWGGFGAVFGPIILISLYLENVHWKSVLLGMIAGGITVILWKHFGWSTTLYEILPGFMFNGIVTLVSNKFFCKSSACHSRSHS